MSSEPALAALGRAVRAAHAELSTLVVDRRRAVDLLAGSWTGGHRARFDEATATLDRVARAQLAALEELDRMVARAAEAA